MSQDMQSNFSEPKPSTSSGFQSRPNEDRDCNPEHVNIVSRGEAVGRLVTDREELTQTRIPSMFHNPKKQSEEQNVRLNNLENSVVEMKQEQRMTNRILMEMMKDQVHNKERIDRLCEVDLRLDHVTSCQPIQELLPADACLHHVTPRPPVQEQVCGAKPENVATTNEEPY